MALNDAEVKKQVNNCFIFHLIDLLAHQVMNITFGFLHAWHSFSLCDATTVLSQIEHMMAFIEQEAKEKVDEIDAKVTD